MLLLVLCMTMIFPQQLGLSHVFVLEGRAGIFMVQNLYLPHKQ